MSQDLKKKTEELFLQGCKENNMSAVRACMDLEVDINATTQDGRYFGLLYAAKMGYNDLTDLLLNSSRIDVNKQNCNGNTALIRACKQNHNRVVEKLLSFKDVDVNIQNKWGDTAAITAASYRSSSCLRLLSRKEGVNWNLQCFGKGFTAAMCVVDAIAVNSTCIDILLDVKTIDWNSRSLDGESALSMAVRRGNKDIVLKILTVSNLLIDVHDLRLATNAEIVNVLLRKMNVDFVVRKIPECPVCFVEFSNRVQVFQCKEGHFTCGTCRIKVKNCPECRGLIVGRAIGFERFLR